MVAATFRYDPDEVAEIENDLGPGALLSPDFTVTIGYRSGTKYFGHCVDESAMPLLPGGNWRVGTGWGRGASDGYHLSHAGRAR